jgi:hypothetical protein
MQIGSEKLLLTLGVQAQKEGESPLNMNNIEVLDISVAKSWNGERICEKLKEIATDMGQSPVYVVSDNASIMNKGIRESAFVHLRDIGHTLAMFLERQYKEATDFLSFMKELAKVKNREVMRPVAYLLPPKQRIIARFMNLTPCLDWAKKMLLHFEKLTKEEQEIFNFLPKYRKLVNELSDIIVIFNGISKSMKRKGLSKESVKTSVSELLPLTQSPFPRVCQAAKESINYLHEEAGKLSTDKSVWHISTDILESMFGVYKARKSPNTLNGVTTYVLMLPLLTRSDPQTGILRLDCKAALEGVFLRDIDKWAEDNLTENLTIKRKNKLKAA